MVPPFLSHSISLNSLSPHLTPSLFHFTLSFFHFTPPLPIVIKCMTSLILHLRSTLSLLDRAQAFTYGNEVACGGYYEVNSFDLTKAHGHFIHSSLIVVSLILNT
jgi:hypothetical protein